MTDNNLQPQSANRRNIRFVVLESIDLSNDDLADDDVALKLGERLRLAAQLELNKLADADYVRQIVK